MVNKSPEKVDCWAAFGARYAAKNVVAAGLASKCSVQLAYAIGIARPLSVNVNTFGTGSVPDEDLSRVVERLFDFTPKGLIESFNLLNGDMYRRIAATLFLDDFPWERADRAADLRKETVPG